MLEGKRLPTPSDVTQVGDSLARTIRHIERRSSPIAREWGSQRWYQSVNTPGLLTCDINAPSIGAGNHSKCACPVTAPVAKVLTLHHPMSGVVHLGARSLVERLIFALTLRAQRA